MGRVSGKVALVTGAGMGIGKGAAVALAREGAAVLLADINDDVGEATAAEIRESGGVALFQHTDVGSTSDIQAAVKRTVDEFGSLTVLVNNAAVAIPGGIVDISEDDWNRVINTNLTSVWRGMKYAIPHMIEAGGGAVINISSVQSLLGFKGWSAYAAAKGGINALTQQAAADYSKHNIRINAVLPGTIMTPMNQKIFDEVDDPEALIANWNSIHLLGRFGHIHEVGNTILFLASDEASFITGTLVRVDGGLAIKGD
ncbi:MAG: SDR family NAD(P)-dependent oxidoreductase [Phototrophicaceae bacterium]